LGVFKIGAWRRPWNIGEACLLEKIVDSADKSWAPLQMEDETLYLEDERV
jgi:hypothetical protein